MDTGTDTARKAHKVTCLGEALAVLIPDDDKSGAGSGYELAVESDSESDAESGRALGYTLAVGGAEANVACSLAALGVPVRWVGRVGDDRFGRVIVRTLASRGVDVSAVEVDTTRLTGLYVKEITAQATAATSITEPTTRMRYYRTGSAACAMGPELAETPALRDTPLLHVSGITPALSESCAALIDAVLSTPRPPGRIISFDVNLRPALWADRDPAVLLSLARRADLVFLGSDEAASICGSGEPDELRRLLPEPRTLVVKQGADGAVGFEGGQRVHAPALPVDVAEATGAGDAFAAGFIAATLRGLPLRDRLRLGTLAAAGALRVRGDFAAMPTSAEVDRFLADDEQQPAAILDIEADAA